MRKTIAITSVVLITIFLYFGYQTLLPDKQVKAVFAGVSLKIEIATSTDATSRGLGGRETVPYDFGMLFVFQTANKYGIWMKDMLVPIDIYWLDKNMRVVSFMTNVATSSYPNVFYPIDVSSYVLETVAGFAEKNGVATGTELHLQNFKYVSR